MKKVAFICVHNSCRSHSPSSPGGQRSTTISTEKTDTASELTCKNTLDHIINGHGEHAAHK